MRRGKSFQRVLTFCPVTGDVVATHAVMTAKEFARVQRELSFWCSSCSQPHHRDVSRLWREGEALPVEKRECVTERVRGAGETPRRAGEGAGRIAPARAASTPTGA